MNDPMPTTSVVDLPDLEDDFPLRAYLGEMSRKHSIIDTLALPNMRDLPPLRIDQMFVFPSLAKAPGNPAQQPSEWPQGQSLFATLTASPRIVVLGDPGSGKTTLANWLAWRLSSGLVGKLPDVLENRLPIHCLLRDLRFDTDTTLPQLAEQVAQRLLGSRCDERLIARLHAWIGSGRYVLILDGVDEVPLERRKGIQGWMQKAKQDNATVLATSRIVGYDDLPVDQPISRTVRALVGSVFGGLDVLRVPPLALDDRPGILSRAIGVADGGNEVKHLVIKDSKSSRRRKLVQSSAAVAMLPPNISWAEQRYLLPFDNARIATFIDNWYFQRCGNEQEAKDKAADLMRALNDSAIMRELARTPNLLSLMAIVHRERAHLPDGKALLYGEIVNAYINTIDQQRNIRIDDPLAPFSWEVRAGWLAYVGFQMQCERVAASEEPNQQQSEAGGLASEANVLKWLEYAMEQSSVKDTKYGAQIFLSWVARRSGLLLPRGEGVYAFAHLSFQEYFSARYLLGKVTSPAFIRNKLPAGASVTKEKLANWCEKPLWQESLIYLLELMSSERDRDWVIELLDTLFGDSAPPAADLLTGSKLAAKIILNRHINAPAIYKKNLAKRFISAVWADGPELQALIEIGYGLKITQDNKLHSMATINGEAILALVCDDYSLADVSFLHAMPNLRVANLSDTQIHDLTPLSKLNHLERLAFINTPVDTLDAIAKLPQLSILLILNTRITDCSPLIDAKSLDLLIINETNPPDTRKLEVARPELAIRRLDIGTKA